MVMWIILGTLIGVVAIFLIITSVLDKKKEKQFKARKAEESKEREASVGNVAIWINEISKRNEELLATFVPSIGEIKMKDVKSRAKASLSELIDSKAFAMAIASEKGNEIADAIKTLDKTNANSWSKTCRKELDLFIKTESKLDLENYSVFKEKTVKVVGEHYEPTK